VSSGGSAVAGGDIELSREEIAADMRIIAGELISVYMQIAVRLGLLISTAYSCFLFRISANSA
jgi:hypothetical protein